MILIFLLKAGSVVGKGLFLSIGFSMFIFSNVNAPLESPYTYILYVRNTCFDILVDIWIYVYPKDSNQCDL